MSTRDEIDARYAISKEMFRKGEISAEVYMKTLVQFAADHGDLENFEDARMLLNECTERYFEDVLPGQMTADPEFAARAADLALALYERGNAARVSDDELMLAFVRPGKA